MLYGLGAPSGATASQKGSLAKEKRDLLFAYADRGVGYRIEDMMSIGLLDGLKADTVGALYGYKKTAMEWVGDHGVANIPAKSVFDFTTIEKWSDRQSAITWYSNPNNAVKYDAANSVGLFLGMSAWCEIKKAAMWYGESGNATDAAKDIDDVTDSKTWASWDAKKQAIIKLKAVDDFIAGHSGLSSGGTSDGLTINKDALRRYLLTKNLDNINSLDNATLIASTSVFLKDTSNGLTKVIPYELLNTWVECTNPVVRDGLLQWFSDSAQKGAYNASFKNFLTGTYTAEQILYALKMAYAVANGTNLASGLSSNDDKRNFIAGLMNLSLDSDAVFASKSLVDTSGASLSVLISRTAMAVAVYNNGRNLAGNLDGSSESSVVTQLVTKTITPAQITFVKDLIDASKRKGEDAATRVQRMEIALGVYNTSSNLLYSGLATGEDTYEIVNQLMLKFLTMNDVTRANISNAASIISTSISETALVRSNRIATAIALYVNNLVGNSLDNGASFVTQVMTTHNITTDEIKTLAPIADITSTSATTRASALNTLRNNYNSLSAWGVNAASRTALLTAITMPDDSSSVIADKRTALAYFANNTALQAAFNSANSAGLFSNLTRWSDIKTVVDNYASATAAGWGSGASTMLGNIPSDTADNRRIALAYFTSDTAAVANRAAFDGAQGKTLFNGLNVWSDAKVVADNYAASTAAGWTTSLGSLLTDISSESAANRRTALAYFTSDEAAEANRAAFDGAETKILFSGLTAWNDIKTVVDNYGAAISASWTTSLASLLTDIIAESAANRRTALAYFTSNASEIANRAAFDVVSGFVTDVAVWTAMQTVVDNAKALSSWGTGAASRSTLLNDITADDGATTVAAQKRTALAYFADGTNGASRRTAFDNVSGAASGSFDIVDSAQIWSAIQYVIEHVDIHDALRTIVLTSHSFYDNLKGSADGNKSLVKSENRSIIRALFDAGFTNGDIRNIAMNTMDTDAMSKNTSADQRALYIALRIVGAFGYLGTDSAGQRQDLVAAVGQTVAQIKSAGDIAAFAFHSSSDVAGRTAYLNSLVGLDSALKVSSSTAFVDSFYRDGTVSMDQTVMMDGLVAAGITSGDLGSVTTLDKAAMALNTSERERIAYLATRAANGFASVASDSDTVRESIIQKILLSKTAKDIYALKNLYTFSSSNGSSDEARSNYIKGVISVNKALLDAGLYSGLALDAI